MGSPIGNICEMDGLSGSGTLRERAAVQSCEDGALTPQVTLWAAGGGLPTAESEPQKQTEKGDSGETGLFITSNCKHNHNRRGEPQREGRSPFSGHIEGWRFRSTMATSARDRFKKGSPPSCESGPLSGVESDSEKV